MLKLGAQILERFLLPEYERGLGLCQSMVRTNLSELE